MAKDRVERRLAAIMATDIVGYSRLIEIDETDTLDTIKRLKSSIFNPTIAIHGGRIVKLMGDGALVVFNSAVDAVNCGVSVQNDIGLDQRQVSPDRRVLLRIGINLADVVVEGDDLFGDGINVAARLEALAHPGGICIADIVQRQLAGKSGLAFEDGGEMSLKNIARRVRVWHWMESPTVGPASLQLTDRPSIAVLPFENFSGHPDETSFSDGITEDIITGLARFRSLSVVAANSSFNFRGKPISLKEIGRQLGVAFLVEGSIRRAGDRIRVTAQLIEAANGEHHWAERFDRGLTDVFAVQDEVAKMIVSTLVGRIEEAKFQQSLRKPTVSLAAYEFYLRGVAHLRGHGDDDNQQACRMLESALERDPRFALAYAYLALARVALHGYADAPVEILDNAYVMAKKAVALDGQESNCHRLLAVVCTFRREFEIAERHFRRAYQLNPNDANGLVQMGGLLARRGRLEEAMEWINEGMRLNPFPPSWYYAVLANALYLSEHYDEAALALSELPNPGPYTHARLAACYAQSHRLSEAQVEVALVLRDRHSFSTDDFLKRVVVLERPDHRELLRQGLLKAGLPE